MNPDHLFIGTIQENMLDAVRKGRMKNYGRITISPDEIRDLMATGLGQRRIAQALGVSKTAIQKALKK